MSGARVRSRASIAGGVLLACPSCSFDFGRVGMIADFPISAVHIDDEELAEAQEVTGRDTRNVYLIFPSGDRPSIEGALQDALRATGADALVDVQIHREMFVIPFLYACTGYRVTGKAVRVLDAPDRPRERRSRLLQGQ